MFGYKSIKWLWHISLVKQLELGYWELNGYPVNAWISGPPSFLVQAPASDPQGTMTATTPERTAPTPERGGLLARFDRVERAVHWTNAILFAVLVVTGAALYLTPLIALVGRRELVERIHLYAGIALPVPLILALSGSWGHALRRDIRRFNRWSSADRRWLRVMFQPQPQRSYTAHEAPDWQIQRRPKAQRCLRSRWWARHAGQRVCLLRWYLPFPLSWRAGATFVHNWLALLFVIVIAGHILMALSDRQALKAMLFGRISRTWAARHAPAWLDEVDAEPVQEAQTVGAAVDTDE